MPSSSFGNVFFDRTNSSSTTYYERNRLSNNGCPRDRIRQHFWNLATDKTVLVDEVTTIPTSTMMMTMMTTTMTMMTTPTKSRRRRRKQQHYHYYHHHHKESTRLPFTFAPSSLLQNMLNVYDDDKETGIVVVYSRSGLGKTIAARLVLNQACRGMMVGGHARSDGIYWKLVAHSLGILQPQQQPQESTCQQPILVGVQQQSTLLLRKKEMLLVEQFQTWVPIWMEQIVMTTMTTSHYSKQQQQQEPIPQFQQEGGTGTTTTTTKLWGYLTEACFSPRCWVDEENNNDENDDDNDDDDKSTDLDDDLLLLPRI